MKYDMALSVSIIVPVYNVENYIEDCFQSIINQTYIGPLECLFIDDCGTDSSIAVLKALLAEYDGPINMRLLHHDKNCGLSAARNTGIKESKSDYIFFLDSDDKIYPYSIDCLSQVAVKESGPDIILGGYQVSDPSHSINKYKYDYRVMSGQHTIATEFLNDKLYCMAPNKLIRREFITDNNLWFKEGIIHEDNLWSFQSFHLAKSVVTVPELTYYYLIHDESIMSSTKLGRRLESCKVIYDEIMRDLKNSRYNPVVGKSISYVMNLMDVRCFRLIEQVYKEPTLVLKDRLRQLGAIYEKYNSLINEFWLSPTFYMKLQKMAFMNRRFFLFDVLMRIAKLKYK